VEGEIHKYRPSPDKFRVTDGDMGVLILQTKEL
jgi:hypothetical protein